MFFVVALVKGQTNCPQGYEEKNVKCNGQIITKCVPINYSCKLCWAVDFEPCPGKTSGGRNFYSSYEKALEGAQKESNNWKDGNCSWFDNKKFKIYLDSPDFCSKDINGGSEAIADLKNKIKLLVQRYRSLIADYKRYAKSKPYKPGGVIKEYENLIDEREKRVNNLENQSNLLNAENLTQIENSFTDLKNDEGSFMQSESNLKNRIEDFNNEDKINTQKKEQERQTQNANTIKQVEQIQQQQLQEMNKSFDNLKDQIQKASDKRTSEIEAKYEADMQTLKEKQKNQEEERQNKLNNDKERQRQTDIDMYRILDYGGDIIPHFNKIPDGTKQSFYITYEREYDNNSITIKTYTVNIYGDGSWMLEPDIEKKINFSTYLLNDLRFSSMLGPYASKTETLGVIQQIKSNAMLLTENILINDNFFPVNKPAANTVKSKDFWNN